MSDARRSSSPAPAASALGTLPVLVLILSIVGLILGSVVLFIHQRLSAGQGAYTSFCSISEGVSCDVVLGSSYAVFLGIPVGGWALLSYLATGGLAVHLLRARPGRRRPAVTALLAVTGAMLGVSLYFLFISTFAIGVLCPMCLSMDAVNVGLFGAAFALFRLAEEEGPPEFSAGRWLALAGVATVLAIVVLSVAQDVSGPSGPITVETVKRNDPRFYAYYISQPIVEPPIDERHRAGAGAPITIVEFSDFQCPYCRRAFLDLQRILAEGAEDVRIIHRNFPLNADCNPAIRSRNHAAACEAAIASECAARQGKETALSHVLFTHQSSLTKDSIELYAAQAGLDMDAFRACLEDPEAAGAVAQDVADGIEAGVESTPTLFINGRKINGGFSRLDQYRYALAIERARLASAGPARAALP